MIEGLSGWRYNNNVIIWNFWCQLHESFSFIQFR